MKKTTQKPMPLNPKVNDKKSNPKKGGPRQAMKMANKKL